MLGLQHVKSINYTMIRDVVLKTAVFLKTVVLVSNFGVLVL